jgi:hypothetical protein
MQPFSRAGSWFCREIDGHSGVRALIATLLVAALSGCMTANNPPPAPIASTSAVSITVADLQGNWGLASFRKEEDRERTEVAAKAACSNPYQVTAGSGGGVMMYLADKTEPSEVFVKVGTDGQVFIGPRGAPAMAEDRQVISYENNVLITEWLDKAKRDHYGTMILVKCSA